MTTTLLMIEIIILGIVTLVTLITTIVIKKKVYNKLDNLLQLICENNDAVGKLGVKVMKNGDDLLKMKQEKSAFRNELNNIEKIIETLNSGFAIPSYKNT